MKEEKRNSESMGDKHLTEREKPARMKIMMSDRETEFNREFSVQTGRQIKKL